MDVYNGLYYVSNRNSAQYTYFVDNSNLDYVVCRYEKYNLTIFLCSTKSEFQVR